MNRFRHQAITITNKLDGIVFCYSQSLSEMFLAVFASLHNIEVTNIPIQVDLVGPGTNPIKSKFVLNKQNWSNFKMASYVSCVKK